METSRIQSVPGHVASDEEKEMKITVTQEDIDLGRAGQLNRLNSTGTWDLCKCSSSPIVLAACRALGRDDITMSFNSLYLQVGEGRQDLRLPPVAVEWLADFDHVVPTWLAKKNGVDSIIPVTPFEFEMEGMQD